MEAGGQTQIRDNRVHDPLEEYRNVQPLFRNDTVGRGDLQGDGIPQHPEDVSHPLQKKTLKRPRSGLNYFIQDKFEDIRSKNPGMNSKEVARAVGNCDGLFHSLGF